MPGLGPGIHVFEGADGITAPAMKPGIIIITAMWAGVLAGAVLWGMHAPHFQMFPGREPTSDPLFNHPLFFALVFAVTAVGVFLPRHRPAPGAPSMRAAVDRRWGPGTFDALVGRSKPMGLFTAFFTIAGATGLLFTFASTQNSEGYLLAGLSMSYGLGVLGAYLLSIRFPPRFW
jgi:hypothetical protein